MKIDADNPVPIFQQIVDRLTAAVAAGIFKPGEMVPSVRQQAVHLLVNPNTVQRAYEHLEREGVLISRRGNGMEVAEGARALATTKSIAGVEGAFAQGIQAGKAAKLSRTTIDGLYRKAWNGHNQTDSEDQTS
jgi:GntR family transcriptional regulator